MNEKTKILAEAVVDELSQIGREDIIAMALLRFNRRQTEAKLKIRLGAVKARLENLTTNKNRNLNNGKRNSALQCAR